MTHNKSRGFEAMAALSRVGADLAVHLDTTAVFLNRGFSDRTIKALAKVMDAPERLLFMSRHEAFRIEGVGKAALGEIRAYRDKFDPRRSSSATIPLDKLNVSDDAFDEDGHLI